MTESAIAITGLTYPVQGHQRNAIEAIDLELQKGEFLVLMGPSEAGRARSPRASTA